MSSNRLQLNTSKFSGARLAVASISCQQSWPSRFDYGSTVLAGLPKQLLDRLQAVQNAAARLVFAERRNNRITPLLHSLHWLRVAERIKFRLAVLRPTYRCLHGSATEYLTSLLYILASHFALLCLLT